MNLISRILKSLTVPFLAASLLAAAAAQPAWPKDYANTPSVKIARDETGAIYVASATPLTIGGRRHTIQKYTAAGSLVWDNFRDDTSNPENQATTRGLVVTNTKVFALHDQVDQNGVVKKSSIYLYARANGAFLGGVGPSPNEEYYALSANEEQAAFLAKRYDNSYDIVFYQLTAGGWTFLNSIDLGTSEPVGGIQMDATNTAVAAVYNATTGRTKFVKASATTGISLQYEFDFANRTNERPMKMVWDMVAQRAYALASSDYSPTDTDPLLFIWNTETGAAVHSSTVRSTAGFDYPGDINLIPGVGVYVSGFNPTTDQRTIFRKDVNGVTTWTNTFAIVSTDSTVLSHGIDAAGNLNVCSDSTNQSYVIERYSATTGNLVLRNFIAHVGANPEQMLMDAAGNSFVNVQSSTGTSIQKAQVARLIFSSNNVTGGAQVNAALHLTTVATSEQVWTVTSGNTSILTAPATITIPAGSLTVNIPLTVKGVASATNVSLNVRFGGSIEQQTLTVIPSVPQSVTATPQVVVGGTEIAGALQMTGGAKVGGQTVTLTSSKPLVASVPASLNLAEGANSANFPITTYGVNSNQGVVITAASGGVQKTVFVAVNAPSLTSISVNPTTIKGGVTGILTLNISGPAPTGGFAIALISGAPGIVMLPTQSSVNAGNTSRNVSMPTAAVTASTNVLIFATRSGIYKTATLTVTP